MSPVHRAVKGFPDHSPRTPGQVSALQKESSSKKAEAIPSLVQNVLKPDFKAGSTLKELPPLLPLSCLLFTYF